MKLFKFTVALALVAIPLMSACKEETKKENTVETEASAPAKANEINTEASGNKEVALNPKHGEPNHRCDIPVGAPLDSPPSQMNTQQSPLINSGSTTGKVNPPHGQPGHRCDIKVGDPL